MQITISLQDNKGLDSTVSTIFGRCPFFLFVDSQSKEFRIEENPAKAASGGAGIQAAQMVVDQGTQAIISGNLGPKAHEVINAANIPVYLFTLGTANEALQAFSDNKLTCLSGPSTNAHSA